MKKEMQHEKYDYFTNSFRKYKNDLLQNTTH